MRRQDKWCDLTPLHCYRNSVFLGNFLCGAQTTLELHAMFLMCASCSLVLKKPNTENDLIVISVTTPLAPPLPPYPPTPSVPHRCRLWSMRNSIKAPPINQASPLWPFPQTSQTAPPLQDHIVWVPSRSSLPPHRTNPSSNPRPIIPNPSSSPFKYISELFL